MDSFTNADAVVVKVSFNGDLRRFSFPRRGSFKALYEQVAVVLGLETSAELVLKYADEDGDLITISSDWELNSAIKPGQLLRLSAFAKASAPAVGPFVGGHSFAAFHQVSPAPADPFGPFPQSGPGVQGTPFGGPASAVPSPAGPFGAHSTPHAGPPPFAHAGPFGVHPHGGPFDANSRASPFGTHSRAGHFGGPFSHAGAGRCGGWGKGFSREEWAKLKKERKASFSPEDWEKLKEERKRMFKEHKKEHKKFGKHFAGHHGQFGPHFGGHPFGRQPYGHPHPAFVHPHPPFGHFDVNSEKLTARFTKDVTIPDGTQFAAGTSFLKTWRLRNEGGAWPAGCVLRLLSKHSDSMGSPETVPVPVEGPVETGVEVDVSVPLVAPSKAGRYTAYYKLCGPHGKKFGQRLWVSIVVPSMSPPSSSSSEGEKEADKYESLVDTVLAMGFHVKRHRVFRLLQKFDGDVARVTQILYEKTQKKALKEQMKVMKKAEKAVEKAAKNRC